MRTFLPKCHKTMLDSISCGPQRHQFTQRLDRAAPYRNRIAQHCEMICPKDCLIEIDALELMLKEGNVLVDAVPSSQPRGAASRCSLVVQPHSHRLTVQLLCICSIMPHLCMQRMTTG